MSGWCPFLTDGTSLNRGLDFGYQAKVLLTVSSKEGLEPSNDR